MIAEDGYACHNGQRQSLLDEKLLTSVSVGLAALSKDGNLKSQATAYAA
jgi:hypothetical protein